MKKILFKRSVFMLDGAKIHTALSTREFFKGSIRNQLIGKHLASVFLRLNSDRLEPGANAEATDIYKITILNIHSPIKIRDHYPNKFCGGGTNVLQLQVTDGDKLKWATFFFTFHLFIFIPFIRKVVFYCVTLCQVKSDRVYYIF